jgi:hypothetical protein
MKRQREDWLKYMDGTIKQTVESAFDQGIFPISEEVWNTVNGGRRKTHISWIQHIALDRRVSTLDAVEAEVAKCRQEPRPSIVQEVSTFFLPHHPVAVARVSVLICGARM